jgi:hypothetical protein
MVYLFYLLNPIFNFELTQYKKSETNSLLIQQHFQLDLFDKIVKPIVLYGSEVWGMGNNDIVERICKLLLHVKRKKKKSNPDFMVYGELGQFPLGIYICYNFGLSIIGPKLRTGKQEKIPAILYNSSLLNYGTNITYLVKKCKIFIRRMWFVICLD